MGECHLNVYLFVVDHMGPCYLYDHEDHLPHAKDLNIARVIWVALFWIMLERPSLTRGFPCQIPTQRPSLTQGFFDMHYFLSNPNSKVAHIATTIALLFSH